MTTTEIISLVCGAIPVVSFLIAFVLFLIRKLKNPAIKKTTAVLEAATEAAEASSSMLKLLNDIIPVAVEHAEKSGLPNGANKKLLAVAEIMQECVKSGIKYENYASTIDSMIENLIEFSKNVNVKK